MPRYRALGSAERAIPKPAARDPGCASPDPRQWQMGRRYYLKFTSSLERLGTRSLNFDESINAGQMRTRPYLSGSLGRLRRSTKKTLARLPMRIIVRGDPFDVTTGNPDVSQFTIGQVREFAPHRLVPPPGLISAEVGSKHDLAVLSPAKRWSADPLRY